MERIVDDLVSTDDLEAMERPNLARATNYLVGGGANFAADRAAVQALLAMDPDVGLRFREMPIRGALIGAIVRDGKALFPHSDEVLQAGDRVIVFTERSRVPDVEKVL